MARSSLWTPLIVILTFQLVLLVCLNLKTSAPTNTELLSVHISASDRVFSRRRTRGSLLNIQNVVQIGAPANELNGERRNGEKRTVVDKNVQIDAPGGHINGAEQRVPQDAAVDPVVERERGPSDRERRVGVSEDAEIKRSAQNGAVNVNRNELRKRSDDEQLMVGEREKANARGDRKGQLQQQGELRGVSVSKEAQDGGPKKKEEPVKDGDEKQVVDKKVDYARESVPNTGRRRVNQVSMLKSHDLDRPAIAARDQNKKPSASDEKVHNAALNIKEQARGNVIQSDTFIKGKGIPIKEAANGANNKRPLIEKVSQLKRKKAGFGRLKDMPFMKARRFVQEAKNEAGVVKPPKFNHKQIEDLLKYSDKLNYFEEFCKEVGEPLVECGERKPRELTEAEKAGQNIMFTIRTTFDYHDQRLPVLFETWLSTVDPRTVFLVTDGEDVELDDITENIGMHYINAQSGTTHSRTDLCCKAGVELELIFYQQNEAFDWLCHVDDDIYINLDILVKTLAKFDPKNEPVYFGRSGSLYATPRTVKNVSKLGTPNTLYHFAVGGIYCLSRSMLEMARDYLVGCEAFSESCQKTQEPEDVTVGLVIGAVLHQELSRTEMIYTHGLDLMSTVPSPYIAEQIAFSYGYGSVESWHFTPNMVYVPGAVFSPDEDFTQFKSIHCHIFPTLQWCLEKKKELAAILEEIKNPGKDRQKRCVCTWKTPMCCELWKEAYRKAAEHTMKERIKQKEKEKEDKERAAKEAKVVGEARFLAKKGR